MALLVLEPWPVDTPGGRTSSLGVSRDLIAIRSLGGLSDKVERVGVGAALTVSTAIVGACCTAATLASKGRKAFAFASGAVAQATSTALAVRVLVVERCILCALPLLAVSGLSTSWEFSNLESCRRRRVNPVLHDIGRGETHRVRALEL